MNSIDEENLNSYDSRGTLQKLMAKMGKGSLRRVILNLSIINICISSLNLSQNGSPCLYNIGMKIESNVAIGYDNIVSKFKILSNILNL